MNAPDTVVGFDGTADDVSVVVMHRGGDGAWRVESTDGSDAAELARMAVGMFPPRTPPHPVIDWPGQVLEWLAAYGGGEFELDDEQRHLLRQAYSEAGKTLRCP